ncbi:MAG: hypothetical protein UH084_07800 [Paludibacteraceae bacterium]|nr:hypothetical protein [Paludibacteraceae bacterium]
MKIFNNYLFRVMSTWFAQYVQAKFQAAQPWLSIINVGTVDNVAAINDAFAADPTATSKTLTQQWPGETQATAHIVYPQIMYIGG